MYKGMLGVLEHISVCILVSEATPVSRELSRRQKCLISRLQSSHSCDHWGSQMLCIVCWCGVRKAIFCWPVTVTDLKPFRAQFHPIVIHTNESVKHETFPLPHQVCQTCGMASVLTSKWCWFLYTDLLTEIRISLCVHCSCKPLLYM